MIFRRFMTLSEAFWIAKGREEALLDHGVRASVVPDGQEDPVRLYPFRLLLALFRY